MMVGFVAAALLAVIPPVVHGYPGEERVLSSKAFEKYNSGDYKGAADLYQQATEVAPNEAAVKLGLGSSRFKSGAVDEALKTFRSVYDEARPLLNAAARYNAGVVEHGKVLEDAADLLKRSDSEPVTDPQERAKAEKAIKELEKAAGEYRDAMLQDPADLDMKHNFEVAQSQIEHLRKLLVSPPQSSQSGDPEQDQQEQQQNQQQNQDQQKSQDQQQQNQDQQQDQNQQQNQDSKQDQQQQPPEQSQPQQNQDQQDEQSPGEQGQQGQPDSNQNKEDEQKADQPGQDDKQPQNQEDQKPQDKPQQEPGEQGDRKENDQKPQQGNQGSAGGSGQKPRQAPVKPGEMSEQDVERLMNSLPDEDGSVLQRLFNSRYQTRSDMERDW